MITRSGDNVYGRKIYYHPYVLADTCKLEKISFVAFGAITDSTLITIRIDGKNISYDTNVIEVKK